MSSSKPPKKRRFNLPLALPLGGMILLGTTTTILGFVLWPEPTVHEDTSTEGWPDRGPHWLTAPTQPAEPPVAPADSEEPDAGVSPAPTQAPVE